MALHVVTEDADGLQRHVVLIKDGEVIHGSLRHSGGYRLPFPNELSQSAEADVRLELGIVVDKLLRVQRVLPGRCESWSFFCADASTSFSCCSCLPFDC